MKKDSRIEIDGYYLIMAPNVEAGIGYCHSLTERAYLVDNVLSFLKRYPNVNPHQVTVYELKQVNGYKPEQAQ